MVFSLCARVVVVMSVQIFCRCKCKRGVTVECLTRATFEKQLTAFHVVLIIIFLSSVLILLTKMRTETKTFPSTRYIFDVNRSHYVNLPP